MPIICIYLNIAILLMEEILHYLGCKKKPVNSGMNYYLSTGAGLLPSTVVCY